MKNLIKLSILLLFFALISCSLETDETYEDECDNPDYSDCNTTEPESAVLKIKLSENSENPLKIITLYDGYLDNNIKIDTFHVLSDYFELNVKIDRRYALTAKYIVSDDTIIAVDGTFTSKTSNDLCDSVCWSVSGENIDLRLIK